jgi:hypothetical protein
MPLESKALEAVRAKFNAVVHGFDVHPAYKRFATLPTHDGGPHSEYDGSSYAYVITERGTELDRRETDDPDDILYWLVSDATREAAQKYELKHRASGVDFRRLLFERHVELMGYIRADWAVRKRTEYDRVLSRYPYCDGVLQSTRLTSVAVKH